MRNQIQWENKCGGSMMRGTELRNCLYFAMTLTIVLFAFCVFLGQHPGSNFEEKLGKAQTIILNKNTKNALIPPWNLTLTDDMKTTFGKIQTNTRIDSWRA